MTITIGAGIPNYGPDYASMRDAWVEAERLGADTLWTFDHFFRSDEGADRTAPNLECLTLLAAMAATTTRARIGPLVACNSYRNPDLHADMARTIDHISGGRYILGIGAGWFEPDYIAYGYPFGTAPSRLRDLAEALPRIRRRLAALNPAPLGPLPILVAGAGRKITLRLAAEHADLWNGYGTPAEYAELVGVLHDHCATVGRDPAAVECTVMLEHARQLEQLDEYVDAGATHLIWTVPGPPYDLAGIRDLIAWRDHRRSA